MGDTYYGCACDCDCELRETVELDPSTADKYHTCEFCQTVIIDPSQTHHPNTGEKAPEGYSFLQPTLSSIYASKFSCSFAKWLCSEWDRKNKSLRKYTSWRDMLPRGPAIRLCVHLKSNSDGLTYERVSRGSISVAWFGLWDPELDWCDREVNPYENRWYPGRCEVGTTATIDTFVFAGEPICNLVPTRPINLQPGSTNTFALMRRWLANCRENHPDCPPGSENSMPDILVKIDAAASQNEEYKLVLEFPAESTPSTRAYLALSYCWGGDQTHKTTRCQIAAADYDLDWTALPASIQDAVKVTANLGFEYLWVDSLCIIQDDPVQKARQMAHMCEVYQNAALTIRACKAKRAVDGFLHPINLENIFDMAVKLSYRMNLPPDVDSLDVAAGFSYEDLVQYLTLPPDGKSVESEKLTGSIYIGCGQDQITLDDDDVQIDEVFRYRIEPIDLRGWTLQERYLSPRRLDFGRRQISWHCPTGIEYHLPRDGWQVRWSDPELEIFHAFEGVTLSDLPLKTWCHFYRLVEEYTGRELGVPRDRILAISAIAEKFRSFLRDEYVAGLWRQTLPYTLLWSIDNTNWRHLGHRPAEYQGPSWSWTAVNDKVSFWFARVGNNLMQTLFEEDPSHPEPWPNEPSTVLRVDANIELEDEGSPVGAVRSGTITGSGRICRAFWFLCGQPKFEIRLHSVETELPEEESDQEGNGTRRSLYRQIQGLEMHPDAIEKDLDGIIGEFCEDTESEQSYGSTSGESEPPEPERDQSERDEGGESENDSETTESDTEFVRAEGPCVEVFLLEVDVHVSHGAELLHGLVLRKVEPTQTPESKDTTNDLDTPDAIKIPLFSRLGIFRIDGYYVDKKVDDMFSNCSPETFRII